MTNSHQDFAHCHTEDATSIMSALAGRRSVRTFVDEPPIDRTVIDTILTDALQAPTPCNHQMWHFVVVQDAELRSKLVANAGANRHIQECNTAIILCTHLGWNHSKFSVIQGLAAGAYHICLSAHLHGLATVWNAGIGNPKKIAELLGIPASFAIIGIIALGHAGEDAPRLKPPRRPLEHVRSYDYFERPLAALYPLKPARDYPFHKISNSRNPYAIFDPVQWGWEPIGDFRGYAIYATSPRPNVYVSRRFEMEMDKEVDALGPLSPGMKILEVMPYAGSYSTRILALEPNVQLAQAALSSHNLAFVRARLDIEGQAGIEIDQRVMDGSKLPFNNESFDVVFLPQIIEAVPDRPALLAEVARVLKPQGQAVISVRNKLSWFGVWFFLKRRKGQVPNMGPFMPLSHFVMQKEISYHLKLEQVYGISPSNWAVGRLVHTAPLRFFSRLSIFNVRKI